MSRLALLAVATLVLASASVAYAAPARMLVRASEFNLVMSKGEVKRGQVQMQYFNRGEDPHDLRLRKVGRKGRLTGRAQSFPVTRPHELSERTVRVSRGRWRLYCTLPGHAARGMKATLKVR